MFVATRRIHQDYRLHVPNTRSWTTRKITSVWKYQHTTVGALRKTQRDGNTKLKECQDQKFQEEVFLACVILKIRPLRYSETSGNIYPTTLRNIPTDLHLPSPERYIIVIRFKTSTTNSRTWHYGSFMLFTVVTCNGNKMTVNTKQIAICIMYSIRSTVLCMSITYTVCLLGTTRQRKRKENGGDRRIS